MLTSPLLAYVVCPAIALTFPARGPDAHRLAHLRQRVGGDLAGLLGPCGERRLEAGFVRAQLSVALAHGSQVFHHRFGYGPLEVAVAGPLELALGRFGLRPSNRREDFDQVRDSGLVRSPADLGPGVGNRAADLLSHRL